MKAWISPRTAKALTTTKPVKKSLSLWAPAGAHFFCPKKNRRSGGFVFCCEFLFDQRQGSAEFVGAATLKPFEKDHFGGGDMDAGGAHAFDGSLAVGRGAG